MDDVSGDFASSAVAGGPAASRVDNDLRRRLHWVIHEAEKELGLFPEDGRAAYVHEETPLLDRLEKILRTALASKGKLDPFRYRLCWTIKNLMVKHGCDAL
jgi:hypothetical protein